MAGRRWLGGDGGIQGKGPEMLDVQFFELGESLTSKILPYLSLAQPDQTDKPQENIRKPIVTTLALNSAR